MVTAVEEAEVTDEFEETPLAALLRICRTTDALSHHPFLMPELVAKNFDKILAHLRQQRDWFTHQSSDARQRTTQAIMHGRAACAVLSNYEMRIRA